MTDPNDHSASMRPAAAEATAGKLRGNKGTPKNVHSSMGPRQRMKSYHITRYRHYACCVLAQIPHGATGVALWIVVMVAGGESC